MIIGIDPGITVGIAILDTKGKIIDITSKREAKRSEIVKHITKFGHPLIIASDVNPLPKMIVKLASSLGSKTFFPEVSLSNVEKTKIIKKYIKKIKSSHQKDALAASLKAFRSYHELFLKIEEILERMDEEEMYEEVVEKVVKSKKENIISVIKKIKAKRKV